MGEECTQTTMSVSIEHLKLPGEVGVQESDLLDRMPDGEKAEDSGTDHIRLISLGCYCGPKLSFKKIGRGSETLPFDWMRTRLDGLLHFMRNDFEGFYDFVTKKPVPNTGSMVMYRGYYHSFWHDDPTDPAMRERYERRKARFFAFDANKQPILFVRSSATSEEVARAPELLGELTSRFGRMACLLLLVDFQATAQGPATVAGHDNLLIHYLNSEIHSNSDGAPYANAVRNGLDWAAGKAISAIQFVDLKTAVKCTDETMWGLMGLGGFRAFEDEPPAALTAPAPSLDGVQVPLESDLLEHGAGVEQQSVPGDGVILASLGCFCGPKLTFQKLGRGAETLPFDWMRVSHEGLIHFLSHDFEGFFDYTTRKTVPGSQMVMYRGRYHSFWHDNPDLPETKEKYRRRIARFQNLGASGRPIVFVRVAASTDELRRAGELLEVLTKNYGEQACLLLIVDFQHRTRGAHVVEGYEDLFVYFVGGDEHEGENTMAPYSKPVEAALEWVKGEPLEAAEVCDLDALCQLADETHWGLVGLGDFDAFEELPRRQAPCVPGYVPAVQAAEEPVATVAPILLSVASGPEQALRSLGRDVVAAPPKGDLLSLERLLVGLQAKVNPEENPLGSELVAALLEVGRPKLLVRVASSPAELTRAEELLTELRERCSGHVCLLIIVHCQAQPRLVSVEGNYELLVCFLPGDVASADSGDGAAYRGWLEAALCWASGGAIQAAVVPSHANLRALASPPAAATQAPPPPSDLAKPRPGPTCGGGLRKTLSRILGVA